MKVGQRGDDKGKDIGKKLVEIDWEGIQKMFLRTSTQEGKIFF